MSIDSRSTSEPPPTTPSAATTSDGNIPSAANYSRVAASDEFAGLRKALRGFVFPMTAAFFLWYALYVILSAYARDFMGTKLIGNINVALVFGLLQFVSTFAIAWLYSRYASRRLDPTAQRIRHQLESDTTGRRARS